MVCADPHCTKCVMHAMYRLHPCNHYTCYDHYIFDFDTSQNVCGICREPIVRWIPPDEGDYFPASRVLLDIASERSRASSNYTWSTMPYQGRDREASSGNGGPPIREYNNSTPTPLGNIGGDGASVPRGRYVPPPLRNPPEPPVRPESSMSNDTFLSQIPETNMANSLNSMLTNRSTRGMTDSTPRYVPPQSTNRFTLLDPFVDSPGNAPFFTPGVRSHDGVTSTYHTPMQAQDTNNGTTSLPNTINRPGFHRSMPPPPNVDVPPVRRVHRDSAAANGFGVDLSQAVSLARLIRSGATDNPQDPDYGNPGRSMRLAPESGSQIGTTPQARGKVMNSDSQAMTVYEKEPNTKGNVAAYLGTTNVELPSWFNELGQGYQPTLNEVYAELPVMEACRIARPSSAGVIKITNIPYACSRSEIVAFLGRAAQIINMPQGSPYHAVHVMIDRGTGKTMDAYVELKHVKEAITVFKQFESRIQAGRHAKIGDREVKVSVISQGELMAELFPYGKNLVWDHNGVPHVSTEREEYYAGRPSVGFNGFLTDEELVHMTKFAETPQRSPFMQRCLIRSYEHLISMLHKYPWFAVDCVLIRERNALFDTTVRNVRALMGLLRKTSTQPRRDNTLPSNNTIQELVVAALTCPGFSEGQKLVIVRNLEEGGYGHLAIPRGMNFRFGGNSRYAPEWPFHALIKQPGVADDVVEYVAGLMRQATEETAALSLAELHAMRESNMRPSFWGKVNVDMTGVTTLAQLGKAELTALETILGKILPRATESLGSRLSNLSF